MFFNNRYSIKKGTLVLLDIYGTNHDARLWENPNLFNPERFQNKVAYPFDFIPQGGGDPSNGHRCPGEGIATEIMKTFLDFLINSIQYDVPAQDFSVNLSRIPTQPKSGFIISNIKRI